MNKINEATAERYFTESGPNKPIRLKYHCGGQWLESKTDMYMDCYNPSTGEVIAYAPQCTSEEVEQIIEPPSRPIRVGPTRRSTSGSRSCSG